MAAWHMPFTGRSASRSAGQRGTPLSDRAATLRRDLRAVTRDGAAFSIMVGSGEAYVPAFALALGLGDVVAGLSAAVPVVAGAILQLVSPWAVLKLGSYRYWVAGCTALQAFSFVPLIIAALVGRLPAWGLLLIATFYWGTGLAAGPAWNTWMGEVLPRPIRARFFASRTRLTQLCVLVGLLGAGGLLHLTSSAGIPLLGFGIAFSIAAAARASSTFFLWQQSEPEGLPHVLERAQLRGRLSGARSRHLLIYMLAVQSSVCIAAPFFTPYMLGPLGLTYVPYTFLVAVAFLGKILALPLLGQLCHRIGALGLLRISGAAIVPLSSLWLVSDNYIYLVAVQICAGIAWGGYELSTILLFFDEIHASERTRLLTLFNLANGFALIVGAVIGAAVLWAMGTDHSAYVTIFALSSCLRLATLLLMRPLRDVPVLAELPPLRTIAARPSAGSIDRPVFTSREGE